MVGCELYSKKDQGPSEGTDESQSYLLVWSKLYRWTVSGKLWMGMGTRVGVVAEWVTGARLMTLRMRKGSETGRETRTGRHSRTCLRRTCSRPKLRGRSVSLRQCVSRPMPPSAPRLSRGSLLCAPLNLLRAHQAAILLALAAAVLAAADNSRGEVFKPVLISAAMDTQKL